MTRRRTRTRTSRGGDPARARGPCSGSCCDPRGPRSRSSRRASPPPIPSEYIGAIATRDVCRRVSSLILFF
jgi:hypothetical protein